MPRPPLRRSCPSPRPIPSVSAPGRAPRRAPSSSPITANLARPLIVVGARCLASPLDRPTRCPTPVHRPPPTDPRPTRAAPTPGSIATCASRTFTAASPTGFGWRHPPTAGKPAAVRSVTRLTSTSSICRIRGPSGTYVLRSTGETGLAPPTDLLVRCSLRAIAARRVLRASGSQILPIRDGATGDLEHETRPRASARGHETR